MKKIFLATGVMMAAATTFAQADIAHHSQSESKMEHKIAKKDMREERRLESRNEVSELTKSQFAIDFPDAKNIEYSKSDNFDEVAFTSSTNENLKAYYDYNNVLVGTTQIKSLADLPEKAQKKIHKEYPGYNVTSVIKFNDNMDNDMDMILYGTTFNDADNYFAELVKNDRKIVVKVDMGGDVSYFTQIR